MNAVEELGASLQTGDPGKAMAAIGNVGMVCHSCHMVHLPAAYAKLGWEK